MIDELNQKSVWVVEVEGAGTVAVGPGFGGKLYSVPPDSMRPIIDVFWISDDKTDVMQRLDAAGFAAFGQLVQSEIVSAGGEVGIFFVRHPLQAHTENVGIELKGSTDVADVKSDMPEAYERRVH